MTVTEDVAGFAGFPVLPLGDAPPPFETEAEYVCLTCGTAIEYSGRGRKPKYCDQHKRRASTAGNRSASGTSNNEKLAAMAVDVLCQGNAAVTVGLMFMRLNRTASAVAERDDPFRVQAYEALKLDPALCKLILKGGASSGKVALVVAYAMMAASVAPVLIEEMKERRAEKEETEDE